MSADFCLQRIRALLDRITYKPNATISASHSRSGYGVEILLEFRSLNAEGGKVVEHPSPTINVPVRRGDTVVIEETGRPPIEFDRINTRFMHVLSYSEIQALDDKTLLYLLLDFLIDMEKHEAQEWFKVDGECFVDPHPERSRAAQS